MQVMQTFFCSFNLPSANNIVTNVNSSAGVRGTGKSLGLTTGSENFGCNKNPSNAALTGYHNAYNVNVGTGRSGNTISGVGAIGVVNNSSTSGLTCDVTRSIFSVKFIIKY